MKILNKNEMKVKNIDEAIKEIARIGKCDWVHIKIINKEEYLINTNLMRWRFWYNKKSKIITMERI